jgi:hypothetical protein
MKLVQGKPAKFIKIILLVLIHRYSVAQSFTKEHLEKVKVVNDLIKDLPDNPVNVSYVMLGTVKGQTLQVTDTNDLFNPAAHKLLTGADAGTKIFIDVKYKESAATIIKSKTFVFRVLK